MQHLLESVWYGVGAFFGWWLLSYLFLGYNEYYKRWMFIPITALSVLSGTTYYYCN